MNKQTIYHNCELCQDTGIYKEKYRCPDCHGYGLSNRRYCQTCRGTGYLIADPIPCPFCKKSPRGKK